MTYTLLYYILALIDRSEFVEINYIRNECYFNPEPIHFISKMPFNDMFENKGNK